MTELVTEQLLGTSGVACEETIRAVVHDDLSLCDPVVEHTVEPLDLPCAQEEGQWYTQSQDAT